MLALLAKMAMLVQLASMGEHRLIEGNVLVLLDILILIIRV